MAAYELAEESVDGPYYLEKVSIPGDSEGGFEYEEITVEEGRVTEGEEDLEAAVKALRDRIEGSESVPLTERLGSAKQPVTHIPEVVDDFLRNFLVKLGMSRTLDCFQTEWFEMLQKGNP